MSVSEVQNLTNKSLWTASPRKDIGIMRVKEKVFDPEKNKLTNSGLDLSAFYL